jgi:alpha-tubulin suppressor-like RCC1 family protein
LNNTNLPKMIFPSNVVAIAAGRSHSLFITADGALHAMGYNVNGQLGDGSFNGYTNRSEVVYASNVVAVAAGQSHSLFLKSDGSLWGMGNNTWGQLGDGFVDSTTPNGTALPEKIFPSPQPVLTCALSSRTNLQISATTGFGGNLYLLGTTNIALQLNQWTAVRTNLITTRGTNNFSITLTNAVNLSSRQLYLLQSQ